MNILSHEARYYETELIDHPSGPLAHKAFQRRELLLIPLKFDNLAEPQRLLLQLLHAPAYVQELHVLSPVSL